MGVIVMSSPNVTIRLTGYLRDHLSECTGAHGVYETPSEYLRDLIRKDMEEKESQKWERLRTALAEGLESDESEYKALTADNIKCKARKRNGLEK